MALIDVNWKPGSRELRQFAGAFLVFGLVFGTLMKFFPNVFHVPDWLPMALWIAAPVVGLIGFALPRVLWPLYVVMMAIALPIGMVVSTVLMLAIYYLVVTPVGLVMRLVGYDPMHRKLDRGAASHWIKREPAPNADRYFRQY